MYELLGGHCFQASHTCVRSDQAADSATGTICSVWHAGWGCIAALRMLGMWHGDVVIGLRHALGCEVRSEGLDVLLRPQHTVVKGTLRAVMCS